MTMIYSKWDILNTVKAIKESLVARELIDPEVTVTLSTKEYKPCRLELHYKVRDDSVYTYKTFYCDDAHDVENVVDQATDYISALKSRTEMEHEEFMAMLGRVMDRAKDLGVDAEFINPLTSMMKKLASNAIEHQR